MARRGHRVGLVSTYECLWILRTDTQGKYWISEAIFSKDRSTASKLSIVEVRLTSRPNDCIHTIWACVSVACSLNGGA